MAKVNIQVLSTNGGEVDAATLARADLDIYSRVAETMENVFPAVQGGFSKAPGSQFIGDMTPLADIFAEDGTALLDESDATIVTEGEGIGILRPFVRSRSIAYVLEFSATLLRFIDHATSAYVTVDTADATVGAWSDETAAPPTGGDPPISSGSSDVTDPFYSDIFYPGVGDRGTAVLP